MYNFIILFKQLFHLSLPLKNIQFPVTSDRSNFTLQQDSILKNIFHGIVTNNLSVAQTDKKISIINVTVNSIEEGFSKEFCETLAKVTSDYYVEIKSKKSQWIAEKIVTQLFKFRLYTHMKHINAKENTTKKSSNENVHPKF